MHVKQVPSKDWGMAWEAAETLERVQDFECEYPWKSRGDPFGSNVCHFAAARCSLGTGILRCEEWI